jgi:hypothetical protein
VGKVVLAVPSSGRLDESLGEGGGFQPGGLPPIDEGGGLVIALVQVEREKESCLWVQVTAHPHDEQSERRRIGVDE